MRKYTLRQFNAFTKRFLKKLDKARQTDALVGSDVTMQELDRMQDETESTLYDVNLDEFDIFE